MADALGRPLTTSGVKEASLRGAAVVVLERLGRDAGACTAGARWSSLALTRSKRSARPANAQRRLYEAVTSEPTS